MRALIILALSLVLANAATVRMLELARVQNATWVFTTSNANYSADVLVIAKNAVIRRFGTNGSWTNITSAANLTYPANATIVRAAIHPTRSDLVVAWRRYATPAEQQMYRGIKDLNQTVNSTDPAMYIVQVTVYNISDTTGRARRSTGINITSWPNWDSTYDIGEFRFIDNLLFIGTGNNYPADNQYGVYDLYQQGRQPSSLQGKLLRIDLDRPRRWSPNNQDQGTPFSADGNPFIHSAIPSTVYATGFVWLYSVIRVNGQLWAADRQSGYADEINAILPAADYGWNNVEGTQCFNPNGKCTAQNFSNSVAPAVAINIPADGAIDAYGISGMVSIGGSNLLVSWNGTADLPSTDGQGLIRKIDVAAGTYEDVTIVDWRNVPFVWYYNHIQFIRMVTEGDDQPVYVLGQYWSNQSSVLYQMLQVDESGAGSVSVMIALLVAVIAAFIY